jgi:hypothetical protein
MNQSSFRITSPPPAAIGVACNAGETSSGKRMLPLGTASTFSEVLSVIPVTYREALRPGLRALSDMVAKRNNVYASLVKLQGHKANSTWPPPLLGVHLPRFELTKEFLAASPNAAASIQAAYDSFRTSSLDLAINMKSEELAWLNQTLAQDSVLPGLRKMVDDRYTEVKASHQQPISWGQDGAPTGYTTSTVLKAEYDNVVSDLYILSSKVILIEDAKATAARSKLKNKKALKADADVEMGDAVSSSLAISDQVNKLVGAALKKANLGSRVCLLSTDGGLTHRSTLGKRSSQGREPIVEKGQDNILPRFKRRKTEQESAVFAQEGSNSPPGWIWEKGGWEGKGKAAEEVVAATSLRYAVPDSYPDEILTIPRPLAVRYLLRSAPVAELLAARFRAHIHVGPGVELPSIYHAYLSAGLKYMFHSPPSEKVISEAWEDFKDRFRWRCIFTLKEHIGQKVSKPYDPDYEVEHIREKAPNVEEYLENGLAAGEQYLKNYASDCMPVVKAAPSTPNVVKVAELKQFMLDRNYVVSMTDKNLGCSVVTRQWFVDRCLELLSDPVQYEEITPQQRFEILGRQSTLADEAATFADKFFDHPQLAAFLRCHVPENPEEEIAIPRFYGIPKIHKTPVKMRPIIPCHGAIQNPAAKYVSKVLKPLVAAQPYVLKGSKDLANRLANLKPSNKKCFLVTGDVVAMYPSIPVNDCLTRVCAAYYRQDGITTPHKALFRKCIRLACLNLICDFQSKSYRSRRGLAMGVACSPDLANLYAAEDENAIVPKIKEFLFYGRFIDDCFAVVEASSQEDAIVIASKVKFRGLEIEWSASEWNIPFLDLLMIIDPETNRVEHKPYRKSRNHLERIPWASHHPKDVKKGTYIGEMSRLAVLCSRSSFYIEALQELALLYIARGYPADLVNAWSKKYSAVRWNNRLREAGGVSDTGDVFVLKSQFNRVWDNFESQELGRIIVKAWEDYEIPIRDRGLLADLENVAANDVARVIENAGLGLDRSGRPLLWIPKNFRSGSGYQAGLDTLGIGFNDRRWLVSRKRGTNLFDLVSSWKKSVLRSDPSLRDVQMDELAENWG